VRNDNINVTQEILNGDAVGRISMTFDIVNAVVCHLNNPIRSPYVPRRNCCV